MAGNGVPTQPTTFPDIHDAGTNAVVMFYQMLLRAEPPTIADEKALLRTPSPVQRILVFARKGNENDPVVLQWLRTHKEWFVPTNMRSVGEIQISSTFRFLQSLNSEKDPRSGWGWVAAISPEAGGAKVTRIRTIIFEIYDGKVDPEGIHLDGLGGETVYTKAMEEYPSIMNGAGD